MLRALFVVALFALTVAGPVTCLVAAGVLVTRVVHVVRHSSGWRTLATTSSLGWLATLVPVGTIEACALGTFLYSPGLLPDQTCYLRTGWRVYPDSSGLLPLSTVCRGQEIVPIWFNPLMVLLVVASVALLVSVPFARVRRRRRAAVDSVESTGGAGSVASGETVSRPSERAG